MAVGVLLGVVAWFGVIVMAASAGGPLAAAVAVVGLLAFLVLMVAA